jgi:N-acetylneuraminate synthase
MPDAEKVRDVDNIRIIAEAGVNHNGSLDLALQLIDVARESGADVVKFQTFKTELGISRHAPTAEYQRRNTGDVATQVELVRKLEFNAEQFHKVRDHCIARGIAFMTTAFDLPSLDFVSNELGATELKIASGEVTHGALLLAAARTGKPIIFSTGMSTLGEVEAALGVLAFGYLGGKEKPSAEAFRRAYCSVEGQEQLRSKVTLLHCTTEYPSPPDEANLRAMDTMAAAFGLPVGLSDHTPGIAVAIAAAARGAVIIEKHFTLDRNLPGPDHRASVEPSELRALIEGARTAKAALGNGLKVPAPAEMKNIPIARRSLVARVPIAAGELFTEENLIAKRPGNGLSPMNYWKLLGQRASRAYEADDLVCEHVD